jgi:uncharacterized tellurite resistance protein B-like protein
MNVIKLYPKDSPVAMARVLAMTMMADACFHPRELEALDRVRAFSRLGLSRNAFLTVASECFEAQMQSMRAANRAELLDDASLDVALDAVQSPEKRELVYRLVIELLPADGRLSESELALLQRMLDRWALRDAALAHALV